MTWRALESGGVSLVYTCASRISFNDIDRSQIIRSYSISYVQTVYGKLYGNTLTSKSSWMKSESHKQHVSSTCLWANSNSSWGQYMQHEKTQHVWHVASTLHLHIKTWFEKVPVRATILASELSNSHLRQCTDLDNFKRQLV